MKNIYLHLSNHGNFDRWRRRMTNVNVEAGKRIRELREIQHYTREGLAEKIGISSKFLYEIETGKKGFSSDILCRISQALSVSCDYIMFGEETVHQSAQKMAGILKGLKPLQIRKMQHILKIFGDMCDAL